MTDANQLSRALEALNELLEKRGFVAADQLGLGAAGGVPDQSGLGAAGGVPGGLDPTLATALATALGGAPGGAPAPSAPAPEGSAPAPAPAAGQPAQPSVPPPDQAEQQKPGKKKVDPDTLYHLLYAVDRKLTTLMGYLGIPMPPDLPSGPPPAGVPSPETVAGGGAPMPAPEQTQAPTPDQAAQAVAGAAPVQPEQPVQPVQPVKAAEAETPAVDLAKRLREANRRARS